MKVRLIILSFVFYFCVLGLSFAAAEHPLMPQAKAMVKSQIKARGITNEAVLKSMAAVARHLFVPQRQRKHAYEDRPLPIGYGQTISQPFIVAYMTQVIRPLASHRVLEIGTGSGYQAAILAEIVQEVYTIEIIRELADNAAQLLKDLNYDNIEVKIADGYHGWQEKAPFDAIVVTAAAEYIPPALIEQLNDGGVMVIPVGSPFQVQYLMLVEKNNGRLTTQRLMPVRFVPFRRLGDAP